MFDKDTTNTIVKAAVVSALGEGAAEKLLTELVTKLLSTKVNKAGNEIYDQYGGQPTTPMLDYFLNRELKMVIEQAVREVVRERSGEITDKVRKAFIDNSGLAEGIVSFISQTLDGSNFKVQLSLDKDNS